MNANLQLDPYLSRRENMVSSQLRRRGIRDERVLAAMERVPRHEFVAPEFRHRAYDDEPLPIGEGQTISQPYIVAFMLQALAIQAKHRVLEIGTGTGYEAAILAELAAEVITIERHQPLAQAARDNLQRLGFRNTIVIHADGTKGWPDRAPYNGIIVAAAAPAIPQPLFEQLAEGGSMVIPVGSPEMQQLELIQKRDGQALVSRLEGCRFVPLIGEEGFSN